MIVVDTSVVIDVLRGQPAALSSLERAHSLGQLRASEITRAEVLAGVRRDEIGRTATLLDGLTWHTVDQRVAERAGELARQWRPSHSDIDLADFVVAATAQLLDATLLSRNVRHFPMFPDLEAPY